MKRSPESRITKLTKAALSASMGAVAFSGTAVNSEPHTINYNLAASASAPEATPQTFASLVNKLEGLHLNWGEGPGQPENGEAATIVLPDGKIVNVKIEAMADVASPRKYMPKPNKVNNIEVLVYPKGTTISRIGIDAVSQYSNSITKNMDTDGNTEKHIIDAQIVDTDITHPDYGFNTENSYFLDVDGSHIHVQIGNSAIKEIINESKANIALSEIENQALLVAKTAEQHDILPILPRPEV